MAKEVKFEASLELQRAITYLEEMASSLKDGKVVVERTEDFVVLEPTHQIQMQLDAAAEGDRQELTFKLSWEKPIEFDLKISSIEPPAREKTEEESELGEQEDEPY